MTEAEWAVCEPLLSAPAGAAGRPSDQLVNARCRDAIRYLTYSGPVWRALPADFLPADTVY
jgi:transposase